MERLEELEAQDVTGPAGSAVEFILTMVPEHVELRALRRRVRQADHQYHESRKPRDVVRALGMARPTGRPSKPIKEALQLYCFLRSNRWATLSKLDAVKTVQEVFDFASAVSALEALTTARGNAQKLVEQHERAGEDPGWLKTAATVDLPEKSELDG